MREMIQVFTYLNWLLDFAVMLELLIPDLGNFCWGDFFCCVVWVFCLVCIEVIRFFKCNSPVGLIYSDAVSSLDWEWKEEYACQITYCQMCWKVNIIKAGGKKIKSRDSISIKGCLHLIFFLFFGSFLLFNIVFFKCNKSWNLIYHRMVCVRRDLKVHPIAISCQG